MAASAAAASGRIFISYRREETAYPAGWLFDRLAEHFGDGQVFKDVDSIELGDDFVEVIHNAVGSCDVLALIGEHWMTITDEHGRRRLDNPDDFVRLEIEAALKRKVRVIPILVEGATMPRADELPSSLATLVRRQALELSPTRFSSDASRLLKVLDRVLAEVQAQQTADPLSPALARPAPGPAGILRPEAAPEEPEDAQPGVEHRATPQARDDRRLLVAHLALVLAACLAGLALAGTSEVRLMRPTPQGELAWLVALLGAAGALALLFHDRNLWHPSGLPDRWYVVPSIWMTVMAFVVPACAAVAVPRRFGIALLAGWIGGAAALFSFDYLWDRYQESGTIDTNPIIAFGFTLLALVVVAVLFARAAPSSQVERAAPG